MTIEFQGHVSKMIFVTSDRVKAQIQLPMHRADLKNPLFIEMSRDEAAHYMPGTGVMIQIRPHGDVAKPFSTDHDGQRSDDS